MNLLNIRKKYLKKLIDKKTYIEGIYKLKHSHLFDYSEYISNTNIKKIEITDNTVIITSRNRGINIKVLKGDLRNHPLEILNFLDVEKEELQMMENLVKDGDNFYDIGANIGWHSMNLALSNRTLNIFSFEPVPSTYNSLVENIKLNSISNIYTFNEGLSKTSGFSDFYFNKSITGNSSLKNLTGDSDVEKIRCKFLTLDEHSSESKFKPNFIKIDVEGAELLVLEGGINTINKYKPVIFAEILRKFSEKFGYDPNLIFQLLADLGYNAYTLNSKKLKQFYRMDKDTVDTNFFFLHHKNHSDYIIQFQKDL
jgi:FkbM family methyltransferase